MDDILFKILYLAVTIIVAVIARYLIPLITTRVNEAKMLELQNFIRNTIAWAEVAIIGSGKGPEKFDLVLEKITNWVHEKNVKITDEQVRILIQGIFAELDGYTVNKEKTISE